MLYQFIGGYPTFYPDERDANGRSLMAMPGEEVDFPEGPPDDGKWVPVQDVPVPAGTFPADPAPVPEPVPAPEPEPVPVEPVPGGTEPAPATPPPAPEPVPVVPVVEPAPEAPAPKPFVFQGFQSAYPR